MNHNIVRRRGTRTGGPPAPPSLPDLPCVSGRLAVRPQRRSQAVAVRAPAAPRLRPGRLCRPLPVHPSQRWAGPGSLTQVLGPAWTGGSAVPRHSKQCHALRVNGIKQIDIIMSKTLSNTLYPKHSDSSSNSSESVVELDPCRLKATACHGGAACRKPE